MCIISMRQSDNTDSETEKLVSEYRLCKTAEDKHLCKSKLRRQSRIYRDALKTINTLEKAQRIKK